MSSSSPITERVAAFRDSRGKVPSHWTVSKVIPASLATRSESGRPSGGERRRFICSAIDFTTPFVVVPSGPRLA